MLEPTLEAYFFKVLKNKSEENKFYGPYNTTINFNLFLGKIIPAGLLLIFPFKSVFLIFAFFMFLLAMISLKVKK